MTYFLFICNASLNKATWVLFHLDFLTQALLESWVQLEAWVLIEEIYLFIYIQIWLILTGLIGIP